MLELLLVLLAGGIVGFGSVYFASSFCQWIRTPSSKKKKADINVNNFKKKNYVDDAIGIMPVKSSTTMNRVPPVSLHDIAAIGEGGGLTNVTKPSESAGDKLGNWPDSTDSRFGEATKALLERYGLQKVPTPDMSMIGGIGHGAHD